MITDTLECLVSPSWMGLAACRNANPELFYASEMTGRFRVSEIKRAVSICRGCPVRLECLSWALEMHDDYAILGGLTPGERQALGREAA